MWSSVTQKLRLYIATKSYVSLNHQAILHSEEFYKHYKRVEHRKYGIKTGIDKRLKGNNKTIIPCYFTIFYLISDLYGKLFNFICKKIANFVKLYSELLRI